MLTISSKKVLLLLTGLIIVIGAFLFVLFNETSFPVINQQSTNTIQSQPVIHSTTTETSTETIPHISSSTNIIEMFGITKDTNATITKDVVFEWLDWDQNQNSWFATQTKRTIIIPPVGVPMNIRYGDFEYNTPAYGEVEFGDYVIKYLNYFIDHKTDNFIYSYGENINNPRNRQYYYVVAENKKTKEKKALWNVFNFDLSSSGVITDKDFEIKKGLMLVRFMTYGELTDPVINYDQDLNEITSKTENILIKSDTPDTYYHYASSELHQKHTIVKVYKNIGGYTEKDIAKIDYKGVEVGGVDGDFNILKIEKGKVYFDKNFCIFDKNLECQKQPTEYYYYDENLDKVVKI